VAGAAEAYAGCMSSPPDNETWLIETGNAVIRKKAEIGMHGLAALEKLIYCVWVADYAIRNAGDLAEAGEMYPRFQSEGARLAKNLSLPTTHELFSLAHGELAARYFDRFASMCEELRGRR
jgi:hypothetical protein